MLTLHKVGTRGRVQLEDFAVEGDFYMVTKDEEGVIVLSPVQVATTGTKRTLAGDQDPLSQDALPLP